MVETPVPNNSSHPISGSGFVVPVPLKGTFFEKKMLAPSLLRKFTKLWIQMTSLQYNSTRQCAVHTVAGAVHSCHEVLTLSPFVSYCCSVYIVQDLVKMGNPIFGDCYLNSISDGIISEHTELCKIRDCRGVDKRAMVRQCWEQVLKVGGTDLKWRRLGAVQGSWR